MQAGCGGERERGGDVERNTVTKEGRVGEGDWARLQRWEKLSRETLQKNQIQITTADGCFLCRPTLMSDIRVSLFVVEGKCLDD